MRKFRVYLLFLVMFVSFLTACQEQQFIPAKASSPTPYITITLRSSSNNLATKFALTKQVSPPGEVDAASGQRFHCENSYCQAEWAGILERPIGDPYRKTIDLTYPYASPGNSLLEIHHGVEFPNSLGVPVLAAAAGEVIYAAGDNLTVLGPYAEFYGNIVVIHHAGLFNGRDLFTLYAHLSEFVVAKGDLVSVGDIIGRVGASGAADGAHLHFEVRLDINDYGHTTNPVLWFTPLSSPDSRKTGIISGVIINRRREFVSNHSISLEKLNADGTVEKYYYFDTYAADGINSNPTLGENFAFPDLPAGNYRLAFVSGRLYEAIFMLEPGHLGFLVFQVE